MRVLFGGDGTWGAAASTLGLTLHKPTGSFDRGSSFSRYKRTMGPPTHEAPSTRHWMFGQWRTGIGDTTTEVLVATREHRSQDNFGHTSYTTYTHVVARIDPPFFAGLDVMKKPWLPIVSAPPTGHPALDASCLVRAVDPARVANLFRVDPTGRSDLVDRIVQTASRWPFFLTDSTVDVHDSALITSPQDLTARLDATAQLAALACARRTLVPRSPRDEVLVAAWDAFGQTTGLTLERERMILSGTRSGARIRVGLEGEPLKLHTVLVVEWPRPLGLGLRIKRQNTLHQIINFLGLEQDIQVGDVAFDQAFVVQGDPARVTVAFGSAALRRALVELALASEEVIVDDTRLVVRWPMAVERVVELDGAVQRADLVTRTLCPVLA